MTRLSDPPIAPTANGPAANGSPAYGSPQHASPLANVPVSDDRAAANAVRDGLAGKHVCPFCGSQNPISAKPSANGEAGSASSSNGSTSAPCPRCTMEDTAATRQNTKARIGPWHVLQTRNPAAPGMRYATLLALVSKGQVTARSVVRGPTTHQLWRYAAHVKGLSREFGVCYSCGEPVEKTATQCPHCDRLQEPSGNPDALLESREAASAGTGAAMGVAMASSGSYGSEEGSSVDPYAITTRQAAGQPILSHADRLRMGIEARAEPRRRPDGRVLSAMELAAALQVAPPPPPPQGHPVRTVIITVAVVAVIASVIIGYARPDLRRQAQNWAQNTTSGIEQRFANFHLQPSADQPTPPDAIGAPSTATPPSLVTPSPAAPSSAAPGLVTTTVSPDAAPSGAGMPTITRNPTPVDQAIASNSHENSPTSPPSQETAQNPTVPDQPHPSTPAPDQPTSPSAVAAQPSMLADQPTLVGPTPSTSEIWALHSRGLDAEGRQDWAQAIQCYQQIELAPKDQWPRDVEVRLANAQRQLNGK